MGDEGAKRLGEMLLAGVGLEPLSSVLESLRDIPLGRTGTTRLYQTITLVFRS